MTHHQSALSTLVSELLQDPDLAHEELFRRLLQAGLQDLIDAEASVKIGAERYERSPSRSTRRNGTRAKRLATPAGELDLAIPKLRDTPMESFFALLQKNVLDRKRWRTREELRIAIITWIERTYHRRRRQARLSRLTPIEYETIMNPTVRLAA